MLKKVIFALALCGALAASAAEWGSSTFAVWPLKGGVPSQTAVVSWSDWLVFFNAIAGKPGVRYVLNEMAASGIRKVWWRTFGGGHALYSSQVPGVTRGNYAGQGADYGKFDSLAEAVEYGHKLGLKVYAWYTPLEESHHWYDNVRSRYTDNHPEMWDILYGGVQRQIPSFYYPAYRDYKFALGREMLDHGIDGLVIDFERRGAPGRGATTGYLPKAVAEFNAKFKRTGTPKPDDPEWTRFRAAWVLDLLSRLSADAKSRKNAPEFAVMYRDEATLDVNLDLEAVVAENLIDWCAVSGHGESGWGSVAADPGRIAARHRKLTGKPVQVILYSLNSKVPELLAVAEKAAAEKIGDIVWFETTYLNGSNKYSVPRRLAAAEHAVIVSPELDCTRGGTIQLVAAGRWTLRFAGKAIASGAADKAYDFALPESAYGRGKLEIACDLAAASPRAGVAVQGVAVGADGKKVPFASDGSWSSDQGKVVTLALAGVPPFLAPLDRAEKPEEAAK